MTWQVNYTSLTFFMGFTDGDNIRNPIITKPVSIKRRRTSLLALPEGVVIPGPQGSAATGTRYADLDNRLNSNE